MKKFLQTALLAAFFIGVAGQAFPNRLKPAKRIAPTNRTEAVTRADDIQFSKDDIITEAPEGKTHSFYRNGTSYSLDFDLENFTMLLRLSDDQYVIGDVVEGNDGFYYFRNPVIGFSVGAYMKGSREGDEIVFKLPQPIAEIDNLLIGVSMMTITDDETFGVMANPVETDNAVRFKINPDGSYTQVEREGCLLGYYYMDDDTWSYTGSTSQTYYPFDDSVVTPPANVEIIDGQMIYGNDGHQVKYAVDGDKFYLGNVYPGVEGYAVGNIEGDIVSFPSYQLIGESEADYHYVFFAGAKEADLESEVEADALPEISFKYDADKKTLSPVNKDEAIVANASAKEIYWLAYYTNPTVSPFEIKPATPANPIINLYSEEWDYGYAYLDFTLPVISTDGNLLDTSKLFYNIYLDDEVLILYPDEYENLTEEIENVPYDFSDGESIDFLNGNHTFYIYSEGYEKVGVQSIYDVNGEVRKSDIVYYDPSAIGSINGDNANVVAVEYFNLMGLSVKSPSNGAYIRKATLSDGSIRVDKVILTGK